MMFGTWLNEAKRHHVTLKLPLLWTSQSLRRRNAKRSASHGRFCDAVLLPMACRYECQHTSGMASIVHVHREPWWLRAPPFMYAMLHIVLTRLFKLALLTRKVQFQHAMQNSPPSCMIRGWGLPHLTLSDQGQFSRESHPLRISITSIKTRSFANPLCPYASGHNYSQSPQFD